MRPDFVLVRLPVRNDRRKLLSPSESEQKGTLRLPQSTKGALAARRLPYTMVESFPGVATLPGRSGCGAKPFISLGLAEACSISGPRDIARTT